MKRVWEQKKAKNVRFTTFQETMKLALLMIIRRMENFCGAPRRKAWSCQDFTTATFSLKSWGASLRTDLGPNESSGVQCSPPALLVSSFRVSPGEAFGFSFVPERYKAQFRGWPSLLCLPLWQTGYRSLRRRGSWPASCQEHPLLSSQFFP